METRPAIVVSAASLEALATEINAAFNLAESQTRSGLAHYRKVGEMLITAKEKCGHGKWLAWLKANAPFSATQAKRYIQLAKSPVTGDLESQWRVIQGNAPFESDEPEAEPKPAKPAPKPQPVSKPAPKSSPGPLEAEGEADPEETGGLFADECDEEPEPPATLPLPGPVKDGLGNPVPRSLVDTFGDPTLPAAIDRIQAAHKELLSIGDHIKRVLAPKSAEFFPYALCGEAMKSLGAAADRAAEAFSQLQAGVPFCVCPQCKGEGCKGCRQSGAWPKHRFDNREQYGDAA